MSVEESGRNAEVSSRCGIQVRAGDPAHVAVIMDGNGRWAKARGRSRLHGHRAGAKSFREIVTFARELGLRYFTAYAFSTENWRRPSLEVRGLMELLSTYLKEELPTLVKNGIELKAIGDLDRLPARPRKRLREVMGATRGLDGMRLTLALSYGARDEITRAVRSIAKEVAAGRLAAEDISETLIGRELDTADVPDPDLIIRTCGENRLSNFLLWQAAYAELYVTESPWPDFGWQAFLDALAWYHGRKRRFGQTDDQLQHEASVSALRYVAGA